MILTLGQLLIIVPTISQPSHCCSTTIHQPCRHFPNLGPTVCMYNTQTRHEGTYLSEVYLRGLESQNAVAHSRMSVLILSGMEVYGEVHRSATICSNLPGISTKLLLHQSQLLLFPKLQRWTLKPIPLSSYCHLSNMAKYTSLVAKLGKVYSEKNLTSLFDVSNFV